MSRITSFEQELSILEKGAIINTVEPQDVMTKEKGVYCLSPGTWVEDPITGEREKIKYWYKTEIPVACPICSAHMPSATFIKTRKHIILCCELCHSYTWLRIVK